MIITKTPYRISFFGGGSDYPQWYKKNGGSVGVAIKILDGNTRAMPAATINLLKHLNLLKSSELTKLDQFKFKTLKNHNGYNVGKIETIIED